MERKEFIEIMLKQPTMVDKYESFRWVHKDGKTFEQYLNKESLEFIVEKYNNFEVCRLTDYDDIVLAIFWKGILQYCVLEMYSEDNQKVHFYGGYNKSLDEYMVIENFYDDLIRISFKDGMQFSDVLTHF